MIVIAVIDYVIAVVGKIESTKGAFPNLPRLQKRTPIVWSVFAPLFTSYTDGTLIRAEEGP